MSINELEKRIATLEDIAAIKQLKARYCEVCDTGHDRARIVTLFAEDGIWEGGDFGTAVGHVAIGELFEGLHKTIAFCQHNSMNPIIEVDGNRAKARWNLWCPYSSRKTAEVRWLAAKYEDDHIKINGEWKYQHLRAFIQADEPLEKRWVNKFWMKPAS
jgi:hypothetical protein